jgi:type IV secretion system protein VirB8
MTREAELAAYFEESASWDADRLALAQRSARRAWMLAAALGILAAAACAAVAFLSPLKTVEPFVIRVDHTTGAVDVVPTYLGGAPLDQTITRYLLMHYVATCERYIEATAEQDYTECGAFHTARRNQDWAAQWERNNPNSPLNRHRDGSAVQVEVHAISFFERGNGVADLAQVRYATVQRDSGGNETAIAHWIATIQYMYGKPPTDPTVRRWNPLGFRILEFHPEPELPDTIPAAVATTASPVGAAR